MSTATPRSNGPTEHTRWNFAFFVAEATFFMAGLAWVDPSAVLPLFVGRLGGSTVIVGVITAMQQVGWKLPQVFMAAVLGHRPRRLPFLRWPILIGIMPFLGLVVYLWVAGVWNNALVIWLLVAAYSSLALGNGFLGISWHDIIAKSIPPGLRGRFFGTMQFTTAVTAFAVGFGVRWMLGPKGPGFPQTYTVLFTAMAVFLCLSTLGCWLIREPIRPVLDRPQSVGEILRGVVPMLRREPAFRSLVVAALLGFGVSASVPFYVVYAKTRLGVTEEMAGVYIWAMTLGGAVASVLWGYLNDSRGPRAVLRGATGLLTATPLLALSIPAVVSAAARPMPAVGPALPYLFGLVFVAIGSSINALWFGATNYLFDLAGDEDRPRYIGVFHLCTLPATLGAIIIGWLLEHVSFAVVFLLVASCGAGALVTSLRMPKSSEHG